MAVKKQIADIIRSIADKFSPIKIILFGSYAYGTPDNSSDVDLMVISDSRLSSWELGAEITASIKHTLPIDIIVKKKHDLEKRLKSGDFFLKNIIQNGKVVYERPR